MAQREQRGRAERRRGGHAGDTNGASGFEFGPHRRDQPDSVTGDYERYEQEQRPDARAHELMLFRLRERRPTASARGHFRTLAQAPFLANDASSQQ